MDAQLPVLKGPVSAQLETVGKMFVPLRAVAEPSWKNSNKGNN